MRKGSFVIIASGFILSAVVADVVEYADPAGAYIDAKQAISALMMENPAFILGDKNQQDLLVRRDVVSGEEKYFCGQVTMVRPLCKCEHAKQGTAFRHRKNASVTSVWARTEDDMTIGDDDVCEEWLRWRNAKNEVERTEEINRDVDAKRRIMGAIESKYPAQLDGYRCKVKELVLEMLRIEHTAELVEISNLERRIAVAKSDAEYFNRQFADYVVSKYKSIVVPIYSEDGSAKIGEREIRIPISSNAQQIKKIIGVFSGDDGVKMREIFKRYMGKDVEGFIEQFKNEYHAAEYEYSKVNKAVDEVRQKQMKKTEKIHRKYSSLRGENRKVVEKEVLELQKNKENILRAHANRSCKKTSAYHYDIGKNITRCDCMDKINRIDIQLARLAGQLDTLGIVGGSTAEIQEVAEMNAQMEHDVNRIQSDYTHKVDMKRIIDKYMLVVQKDVDDKINDSIKDDEKRLDELREHTKNRQLVISGKVELPFEQAYKYFLDHNQHIIESVLKVDK